MDIKLKNKYWHSIVFIICAYMFAISNLSVHDFIKNRNYLKSTSYFTTPEFQSELVGYFSNIQSLNGIYKDYSKKSEEEKVTKEELISSKMVYDSNFKNKEDEINNKYKNDIIAAQVDGDGAKLSRLIDAKIKEFDDFKKENSKTLDDFKKEIATYKTKDYDNIKKAVEAKGIIKYYITKGKNKVVNTNIENVSDIESYIKNNALYSINFSEKALENNYKIFSIKQWLGTDGKAYFIIPKDIDQSSYIYKNYNYYNSVRERIIKEAIMACVSFSIGITMLILILKKNNEEMVFIQKSTKLYKKLSLDARILIFIIYSVLINLYINTVAFFYKPYNFGHVYTLTIITIYILYFIFNFILVNKFRKNKGDFRVALKESIFNKLFKKGITILTFLFGIAMFSVLIQLMLNKKFIIIPIAYSLCYLLFMLIYFINKIRVFNNIIKGTEEIVAGNLNYNIEEKGNLRGRLFKLSHNINNMKTSFKKSLENEVKSERLKSELITNVSHDLKTPLTSIINYIDLLKKQGLSKEDSDIYIDVLDKKSQRLKILIDDLFEASKMASGAIKLNMEKVDVIALLKQSLAELDEKINKSSLTFKLKVPKQKVYAKLDGRKTWRVFENLINNILKYSQAETRVYIELEVDECEIIITMKNISSYEMDFDKEEIFERFIRGDKSRNTEGSGLGLSIAKSIIEFQGGNLNIEIDGDLFKAKITLPNIQ